jgi:hypothetical protein
MARSKKVREAIEPFKVPRHDGETRMQYLNAVDGLSPGNGARIAANKLAYERIPLDWRDDTEIAKSLNGLEPVQHKDPVAGMGGVRKQKA